MSDSAPGRILETSGSTGDPKWVYWAESDLFADRREWSQAVELTANDVVFNMHPLDFGHGIDVHVLPALCSGATVVHAPNLHSPKMLLEELISTGATYMSALPSHYDAIASLQQNSPHLGDHLTKALTGGALLSAGTATTMYERYGVTLRRLYGATEAGIMCADLRDQVQRVPELRPMEGVEMTLRSIPGIDYETHRVAEPLFRRDRMFTHYWGEPTRTTEVLREGWYASGDAVVVTQNGEISVLGRIDDVWVDHSGKLRSASELLDAYSQLADVEEVAVFSPEVSQSTSPTLICRISLEQSDIARIMTQADRISDQLRVKPRIYLVSDWPKTAVGKPDRRALLAWAQAT